MTVRIIVTKSSVWQFDEANHEFRRSPLVQGLVHPIVEYAGSWQPYVELVEDPVDDDYVNFVVVVPNWVESLRSRYRKSEQGEATTASVGEGQ